VRVAALSATGPLVDADGSYGRWFDEEGRGWSAVAVRPDFYVFGAAGGDVDPRTLALELLTALGRSAETGPAETGAAGTGSEADVAGAGVAEAGVAGAGVGEAGPGEAGAA
jgi:hypothetical protein